MRVAAILCLAWFVLGATVAHAETPAALKWLSLNGQKSQPKSAKGTGLKLPPVLTSMTTGTKRMVSRTKDLLTPDKPPKKTQGVVAVHKPDRYKRPEQSWFGRMFNPQPDEPPQTVGEWMSLKQVRP